MRLSNSRHLVRRVSDGAFHSPITNIEDQPMISHIHAATIVVSDQEKAIKYYRDVLGFDLTDDVPMGPTMRWVTVAPPGAATRIALSLPSWHTKKPSLEMGIETGIAFSTPDMASTYAALKKRGVAFKGEPEMQPWGKPGVWFQDPDGNSFFMAEA
jgi:lactoylglutathione lyase